MNPLVTVIIPVYNAGQYLLPAVESIIGQTYENLEIFIVDDGSSDDCIENIRNIKDDRIVLIEQENTGKAELINRILPKMSGKYYVIQDADDISYPDRIESLINVMESVPDVAIVFSGYDLIIKDKVFAPIFPEKSVEQCRDEVNRFVMPSHDPTAMFRVSMVKDFRYNPKFKIGQGFDYILRIAEKHSAKVLGKCLYSYRINLGSNTRASAERRLKMESMVIEEAHKRRGMNFTIEEKEIKDSKAYRVLEAGIVSHFMEYVIQEKKSKKLKAALQGAFKCLSLHPQDIYYYKPIIYFIIPLFVIKKYRTAKKKK